MRPCSCNRVTNDIIWTEDNNNWKLEFPDRRDWLIFKELYKECSNRNVQVPSGNIIPVPGVYEVSGYADSSNVDFRRPISYISVKDDELSRALAKRTANYDMDSDDEEWLRTLNNESFAAGNEQWEHISEEIFELIIDAFEKAFYCSPDDYSDEKAAVDLCLDLERKEVVEAVYNYWLKKRKQKRSALIRVFQVKANCSGNIILYWQYLSLLFLFSCPIGVPLLCLICINCGFITYSSPLCTIYTKKKKKSPIYHFRSVLRVRC
ncbi:hypothetical protein CsSME_00000402 [Camellia sinensis var. sinensis]